MSLNISNNAIVEAFDKGYRIVNGAVISPFRKEPLKTWLNEFGYIIFAIRDSRGKMTNIAVHRMVAYQKYGPIIFDSGMEVRHLDGNEKNNLPDNISYGTAVENAADKDPIVVRNAAISAATYARRFTDSEVEEIRQFHNGSYKETMDYFGITSKGTLHHILNHKYVTKK